MKSLSYFCAETHFRPPLIQSTPRPDRSITEECEILGNPQISQALNPKQEPGSEQYEKPQESMQ